MQMRKPTVGIMQKASVALKAVRILKKILSSTGKIVNKANEVNFLFVTKKVVGM